MLAGRLVHSLVNSLAVLSEHFLVTFTSSFKAMVKGEGKRFLHGDLICTYILSEYISDIYVDGLCIISVKLNFESGRHFVRHEYQLSG